MKNIKKRDLILIIAILLAAAVLLVLGLGARKAATAPNPEKNIEELHSDSPSASETPVPEALPVPEDIAAQAAVFFERYPAESYLVIQTSTSMYMPIPLAEDGSFKVRFGEDEYNLIHIGKNSVYMEESTCDNQNCVGQGEITLENREERILFNMILCLPHDLSLELIDAGEAYDYLVSLLEMQAAYAAAGEVTE